MKKFYLLIITLAVSLALSIPALASPPESPIVTPTAEPTQEPTPTTEPTPTIEITPTLTLEPTLTLTPEPTDEPTPEPTPGPGPITPPGGGEMSAELISWVFVIAMSLAFSYAPGLQDWYTPKPRATKQAIMGIGVVVVAACIFGLSCAGIVSNGLTCDRPGLVALVVFVIEALVVNQTAFALTKKDKVKK